MKCKVVIFMILLMMCSSFAVYAAESVRINGVDGEVVISGTANAQNQVVTFAVTKSDITLEDAILNGGNGVVYVGSARSGYGNKFMHRFKMPVTCQDGAYNVYIRYDTYQTQKSVYYTKQEFADGDFPKGNYPLTAKVDVFGKTITISGTTANSNVTTSMVLTPESTANLKEYQYVGQTVSDANGKYSLSFEMDMMDTSGTYQVAVSGNKVSSNVNLTYQFSGYTDIKKLVGQINSAKNVSEIAAILNNEANRSTFVTLGCYIDQYYALSPELKYSVCESVYRSGADYQETNHYSEVADVFNTSVIIGAFHTDMNEEQLKALLITYQDLLDIDMSETSAFMGASASIQQEILTKMLKDMGNSIAEIRDSFHEKTFLSLLNNNPYSKAEAIIMKFKELLGIDTVDYENLSGIQKVTVTKSVTSSTYQTTEAFKTAFKKAVSDAEKAKDTQIGGGSSGGGGGSSSAALQRYIPETLENKTNTQNVFTDLTNFTWAEESILALHQRGVVSGDENGKFNPAMQVTKEQFIKMVVLAFGLKAIDTNIIFSDVSKDAWYYEYVEAAVNAGLVKGDPEGKFGVGTYISRQDIAVILDRAADIEPGEKYELFQDHDTISSYALKAVYALKNKGILSGKGDNEFKPQDTATRAEAAKLIYGIIQVNRGMIAVED